MSKTDSKAAATSTEQQQAIAETMLALKLIDLNERLYNKSTSPALEDSIRSRLQNNIDALEDSSQEKKVREAFEQANNAFAKEVKNILKEELIGFTHSQDSGVISRIGQCFDILADMGFSKTEASKEIISTNKGLEVDIAEALQTIEPVLTESTIKARSEAAASIGTRSTISTPPTLELDSSSISLSGSDHSLDSTFRLSPELASQATAAGRSLLTATSKLSVASDHSGKEKRLLAAAKTRSSDMGRY